MSVCLIHTIYFSGIGRHEVEARRFDFDSLPCPRFRAASTEEEGVKHRHRVQGVFVKVLRLEPNL